LIDVYTGDHPNPSPNPTRVQAGHYQQLVRGEPLRGKYRDGMASPKPFQPGQVTQGGVGPFPDICHTFRTGHRIMIQVQSSWFPLMDRNPQKFCDIYHAPARRLPKGDPAGVPNPATPSGIEGSGGARAVTSLGKIRRGEWHTRFPPAGFGDTLCV
jgi:predicted acyl esterase